MAKWRLVLVRAASPHEYRSVQIPQSLFETWQLQPGQSVGLRFGSMTTDVRAWPLPDREDEELLVSQDVLDALPLSANTRLFVRMDPPSASMRLGPLLGIAANVRWKDGKVIGIQEPVFRKLLEAAHKEHVYAYILSPREIHWGKGTVKGYTLVPDSDHEETWRQYDFPLPDVVYDQIISRSFEHRDDVRKSKRRLYNMLYPCYFNAGYFDKWQVHSWLAADEKTVRYLPPAMKFERIDTACEFIQYHRNVYMKPVHGSRGVGIIRMVRFPDGTAQYQMKKKNGEIVTTMFPGVQQALLALQGKLKRGGYVIQAALKLLSLQGCPFDIRVILQKDGSGQWKRTKMVSRVARAGDITSNLSTGGNAFSVREVLGHIFKDRKQVRALYRRLCQVANLVPRVIEEQSRQQYGEMGLDFGIDEAGAIWIIEVNSRPWKTPGTEKGSMELVNLSFLRPVQYAKSLAMNRD
jgi:hypothetical protein